MGTFLGREVGGTLMKAGLKKCLQKVLKNCIRAFHVLGMTVDFKIVACDRKKQFPPTYS